MCVQKGRAKARWLYNYIYISIFFPQSRHQMLSSNSESYALWYGNIDICIPRWFPIKLFPDDLTGEELSAPQSNFLRDFS